MGLFSACTVVHKHKTEITMYIKMNGWKDAELYELALF